MMINPHLHPAFLMAENQFPESTMMDHEFFYPKKYQESPKKHTKKTGESSKSSKTTHQQKKIRRKKSLKLAVVLLCVQAVSCNLRILAELVLGSIQLQFLESWHKCLHIG